MEDSILQERINRRAARDFVKRVAMQVEHRWDVSRVNDWDGYTLLDALYLLRMVIERFDEV